MKILAIASLTLLSFSSFTQQSVYIFEREEGESANDFVERSLYELFDPETVIHPVLEGYWGDESKGKKIMAFYNSYMIEGYGRASMVVLQPTGNGRSNIPIFYNDLGVNSRYYEGILSVFYLDVNQDGIKELGILEKGGNRVATTVEYMNDDGEMVEEETTACCEYEYWTSVIEQSVEDNGWFLPLVKHAILPDDLELYGLETAGEIKAAIKAFHERD